MPEGAREIPRRFHEVVDVHPVAIDVLPPLVEVGLGVLSIPDSAYGLLSIIDDVLAGRLFAAKRTRDGFMDVGVGPGPRTKRDDNDLDYDDLAEDEDDEEEEDDEGDDDVDEPY